ncbi:fructose-1-phosphate/6-phosphogluconate phosphatase, partial [Escherichia coli]|uniref:fructose-1-phosphate/6-phosphogluconate phosphatase n=1 Tax=Escherichia coli TaxID=562 RepID=UPI0029DBA657
MYERYAGLIFDMDGTILDTEPTHRKAWREVLGHYGLQYDVQAMIALNGSPTWRIAQAIIELNQADLDPHALAREKTEAVRSMLLDSVEPLPLVEVVKSWHGRRPMAVGTGSESAIAEALLAHLGLRRYFDAVVAADHVKHHKPAGTVAKLAMRQPFVLFKGLTFQKLCLPGAFRPGDHHNKMLRPG